MMDGAQLSELIETRRTVLSELLEIGGRQISAIAAGRMSELMSLLAAKQVPLGRLGEISARLREAAGEDAESRRWESSQARDKCRQDQDDCEQMHLELLAIEAQCEAALVQSRAALEQQLSDVDAAHQAATSYANSDATPTMGIRLDLSSD